VDGVISPSSEIRAVLKSEPTRADFSDDADGFEIEAATGTLNAFAFGIGAADILAGRASDDKSGEPPQISEKSGCRKGADIVIDLHAWVVFRIERAPPCLDFARGDGREARAGHAERPSAGGCAEQVESF
tara:strand:+ start:20909 stop:21298 length:390 start_codon:yes stop_codon:yes gene_type:complete